MFVWLHARMAGSRLLIPHCVVTDIKTGTVKGYLYDCTGTILQTLDKTINDLVQILTIQVCYTGMNKCTCSLLHLFLSFLSQRREKRARSPTLMWETPSNAWLSTSSTARPCSRAHRDQEPVHTHAAQHLTGKPCDQPNT